jgi:hypothetical protein
MNKPYGEKTQRGVVGEGTALEGRKTVENKGD